MASGGRDYIPLSHTYPCQKPFMDENGKRKLNKAPDLRVKALNQAAAKRACVEQTTSSAADGQQENDPPSTDFSQFNQSIRQQQKPAGRQLVTLEDLLPRGGPTPQQTQAEQLAGLMDIDVFFPASQSRDGFSRPPLPPAGSSHGTRLDPTPAAAPSAAALAAAGGGSTGVGTRSTDGLFQGASRLQQQQQHLAPPAAAAAAPPTEPWDLEGLLAPPWDWSCKSRLKLASPTPLALLQEAGTAGMQHAAATMTTSTSSSSTGDLQERLARALVQWQHPADTWPPHLLAALQPPSAAAGPSSTAPPAAAAAAAAGAGLLRSRLTAWREALRGLMGAVRHGTCPVACVVGAMAGRQGFSVLLAAPGLLGCSQPAALVGRASKALQGALAATGTRFTPLPAAAEGRPASKAGGGGEVLLVRGARNVHALYLALLQQPWCGAADQPDVPLLLAPVPFWGASLTQLHLKVLPDALSHAGAAATTAAAAAADAAHGAGPTATSAAPPPAGVMVRHWVQVEAAAISPWCVARLAGVLQDQHQDWDMWLTPEPTSSSLNLPPGAWEAGDNSSSSSSRPGVGVWCSTARAAPGGSGGGGLSAQELQEMADSSRQLKGRVVTQLSFRQGQLAARLRTV